MQKKKFQILESCKILKSTKCIHQDCPKVVKRRQKTPSDA